MRAPSDDERPLVHERLGVAELRGQGDVDLHPQQPLEVVFAHHAHVIARAAGDDVELVEAPQLLGAHFQLVEDDAPLADARRDRLADGLGLLHDLLEHEVGVAALFRVADVPVDGVVLLFDLRAEGVVDDDPVGADDGDLAVLHIGHVARVLDDRRHVRGDEMAALAVAEQQRRVLARGDEALRQVGAEDAEGVGALDAVEHAVYRVEDAAAALVVIAQQLRDDLGVRLRAEAHARGDEKALELDVVFDDAVVHDGDALVLAQVRVGVDVVGLAVRGPARVPHAHRAAEALSAVRQRGEHLQPALGLADLQALFRREHRDARRVVAPVFQVLQPVEQDRPGLLPSRISDDPAHGDDLLAFFLTRLIVARRRGRFNARAYARSCIIRFPYNKKRVPDMIKSLRLSPGLAGIIAFLYNRQRK